MGDLRKGSISKDMIEDQHDHIEEAVKRASKELADEIDFDLLATLYLEMGWTEVKFNPKRTALEAWHIREWLNANCVGHRASRNTRFLFERKEDATLFLLRWQ